MQSKWGLDRCAGCVQGVFQQLKSIATLEGHKSQDAKKSIIMKLLAAAKDAEPGFLIRSIQGKLRIGLAEQSVLVALAQAISLEVCLAHEVIKHNMSARPSSICLLNMCGLVLAPTCAFVQRIGTGGEVQKPPGDELANMLETAAVAVRTAYCECPDYEKLIPALLEHGTDNLLQHVHFEPGTPVKAMLARPTNGVSEVLDKFAEIEFTCEYKYDGERAQVRTYEAYLLALQQIGAFQL